jgi:hypothetical protein
MKKLQVNARRKLIDREKIVGWGGGIVSKLVLF